MRITSGARLPQHVFEVDVLNVLCGTTDIMKISKYVGEAIRIIALQKALFDCIQAELLEKEVLTARKIDEMADELLVADPLRRLRGSIGIGNRGQGKPESRLQTTI